MVGVDDCGNGRRRDVQRAPRDRARLDFYGIGHVADGLHFAGERSGDDRPSEVVRR